MRADDSVKSQCKKSESESQQSNQISYFGNQSPIKKLYFEWNSSTEKQQIKEKPIDQSGDDDNDFFLQDIIISRKQARQTLNLNKRKEKISGQHLKKIIKYLEYFDLPTSNLNLQRTQLLLQNSLVTQLNQKLIQNGIIWRGMSFFPMSQIAQNKQGINFSVKNQIEQNISSEKFSFQILSIINKDSPSIFQIRVRLANFYLTIFVLEESNKLCFNSNQQKNFLSIGSFGQIFLYQSFFQSKFIQLQKYVVKSLQIKKDSQFIDTFFSALKQYSFSLIMSALEIGPKINRYWGFDLIVKENKIEFLMEFCEKYEVGQNQLQKMTADLKKSLRIMHHFHMIHHDIKPENIAFSPHFNKWVFIDYGLSTVIEEKLGEKSMVKFLGTFQFTTEEMRRTFFKKGLVDLYCNDLFGLQQAMHYYQALQNKKTSLQFDKFDPYHTVLQNHGNYQDLNSWKIKHNDFEDQISENRKDKKSLTNHKHTHKNVCELLFCFKYSIFIKDKCTINKLWSYIDSFFVIQSQKGLSDFQQSYQNFLENIFCFLEQFHLTNFIRQIYQQISSKSCCSFKIQTKIEKKIIKPFMNPYKIRTSFEQPNYFHKSRISSFIQNHSDKAYENLMKMSEFLNFRNENEIKNILLFKSKLLKTQEYFELYFNYITFRKKMFNCTFQDKIQVTEVFLANVNKFSQQQTFMIDFQKKSEDISKGRSLILNAVNYLISYCSLSDQSSFKAKYFTELVTEFVFINPLILAEDNLDHNYELQYVKMAIKISVGLTQFLMMCFKIVEAFKFLHYKNEHLHVTYFEKENYFGNYLFLYLTEKKVISNMKGEDLMFLLNSEGKNIQLQINQKFVNHNVWDIKEGIRLFQLLEQIVHSNWVEENNFFLKDYSYFKTKYLQFKLHSQQITSLSHRDRIHLENCLKVKYIKLVLASETIPAEEQEELLIAYKRYETSNIITIRLFQITQKYCEEKDIRNYSAILAKVDQLINCPQISSQYLINYRSYANCSNCRLEICISQVKQMVSNIKIHCFGMFYLCDLIRFFKPLRSWKYRITNLTTFKEEIQVLEDKLFRKVVKILQSLIRCIENQNSDEFIQIKERREDQKCKKDVVNIFNHLNLTLRFKDLKQQKQFYELYELYFEKYSKDIIELKYQRLKRLQESKDSPYVAEYTRARELKDLVLRIAHYEYRIQLQTYQFNQFLQKFQYYDSTFHGQNYYYVEFLANYLKVVSYKKMNVLNTIYRGRQANFLLHCEQIDKAYFSVRPKQTLKIMQNSKHAIAELTEYFKRQISFEKFSFKLQILNCIIIHLWDHDSQLFFQHIIEKQSAWIQSDQTVHFNQTYYYIIDLVGTILMPYQPKRSQFVRAFVRYAQKNLQQKFLALYRSQTYKSFKPIAFYEVFVILQISSFFFVNELYEHSNFIITLLKVATLSLSYQTSFSRPLLKNFVYMIFYNSISEREVVKKMEKNVALFTNIRLNSLSYRNFILRKLIKQDSMKRYFFVEDCPAMIRFYLELKPDNSDSDFSKRAKGDINSKLHKILQIMYQGPSQMESK